MMFAVSFNTNRNLLFFLNGPLQYLVSSVGGHGYAPMTWLSLCFICVCFYIGLFGHDWHLFLLVKEIAGCVFLPIY